MVVLFFTKNALFDYSRVARLVSKNLVIARFAGFLPFSLNNRCPRERLPADLPRGGCAAPWNLRSKNFFTYLRFMKSKGTAAIITFFLGGFGIHRFYLGQVGVGFLYLLFCWLLIPFIVAFFDFWAFVFMSRATFDRKYNQQFVAPGAGVPPTAKVNKHICGDGIDRTHQIDFSTQPADCPFCDSKIVYPQKLDSNLAALVPLVILFFVLVGYAIYDNL